MDVDTDVGQLFVNTWLKSHYDIFDKFWKDTQIPEIVEQEKLQEKSSCDKRISKKIKKRTLIY